MVAPICSLATRCWQSESWHSLIYVPNICSLRQHLNPTRVVDSAVGLDHVAPMPQCLGPPGRTERAGWDGYPIGQRCHGQDSLVDGRPCLIDPDIIDLTDLTIVMHIEDPWKIA